MTRIGRIDKEFQDFKQEVLERLERLESGNVKANINTKNLLNEVKTGYVSEFPKRELPKTTIAKNVPDDEDFIFVDEVVDRDEDDIVMETENGDIIAK